MCSIVTTAFTPQKQLLKGFNILKPLDSSVLSITLNPLENNLAVHLGYKKGESKQYNNAFSFGNAGETSTLWGQIMGRKVKR